MNQSKFSVITSVVAIGMCITILTIVFSLFSRHSDVDIKSEFRATSVSNAPSTVSALRSNSFFTPRNVVNCVDLLLTNPNRKSLRIVFIGDSIVRNQFLNFIKLIPNYDRITSTMSPWRVKHLHEDVHVTYRLLNDFQVSFLWRPLINDAFLSEFKNWKILDDHQIPYIIFLGVTVHHMMNVNQDGRSFEQQLEQHLLPILQEYLTIHPLGRLVWLIQPSSLDRHVSLPMDVKLVPEINADRIHQYNQVTRRILKRETRIVVWDFDSSVQEFQRSCALVNYQREDYWEYFFCKDNHHPPLGVLLSFATNLLYQYVCYSTE